MGLYLIISISEEKIDILKYSTTISALPFNVTASLETSLVAAMIAMSYLYCNFRANDLEEPRIKYEARIHHFNFLPYELLNFYSRQGVWNIAVIVQYLYDNGTKMNTDKRFSRIPRDPRFKVSFFCSCGKKIYLY